MTEYERLLMREPDEDDLKRCPDALMVLEAEDMGIVWPCTRDGLQELRDLCDQALNAEEPAAREA